MFSCRRLLALFWDVSQPAWRASKPGEKRALQWGRQQGAGVVAFGLKAGLALCRRCCGNPFLGEVLAGCAERLQLGGNEHASPRDVVCAALSVEVGVLSVLPPDPPSASRALVFAGVTPAVAWNRGCSGCLSAGRPAARPASGGTALNAAPKGDARAQPSWLLPTLIPPCAPCLPPVSSARNWALAGQDSHM